MLWNLPSFESPLEFIMKMKKVLVFFILLLSLILPAAASERSPLTFQFGFFDEQGFFSNYAGLSAEADMHLGNLKFGLNQKFYYGLTYGELCGQTNVLLYVHDSIYINLGTSYLVSESPDIRSTDFGNRPLPVAGFGFNIAIKNPRIIITPFLQMNQSYYLSDSIRPIYSDLPFPLAMTLGCALNFCLGKD